MSKLKYDESFAERAGECAAKGLNNIRPGKCTVTTETCRDGDFRKSTERQLPPNLKAIRYWLAGAANREVRSQESGVRRMGTGAEALKTRSQNGNDEIGRLEPTYAQGHCKVSEWESPRVRECAPLAGPANAGEKSGKREKWSMSKIRLIYVQNVQNCRSNEVLLFVFEGLY